MDLKFHKRDITPQVFGDTVKEKMLAAAKYRDAGVIGQGIVGVQTADSSWSLDRFEKLFREENTDIYLLAVDRSFAPANQQPMDFRTEQVTTYWLWICVNGKDEAVRTMTQFNIESYEQNIERLKDTGMMVLTETCPQTIG